MSFFSLLKAEGLRITQRKLLAMITISGITSAGVLASVNYAAKEISKGKPTTAAFFIFLALVTLNVLSSRFVIRVTTSEVEHVVHRLRLRLTGKLRDAQLNTLEKLGPGVLYAAIGKDTQTLSQLASVLTNAAQSVVLIFFGAMYLAWLSPMALAVAAGFVALAVGMYLLQSRKLNQALSDSGRLENRLFDRVSDFVDGFKETRMNRGRSDELYGHFAEESEAAARSRISAMTALGSIMAFAQTTLFLLVGTMVFVVPVLSSDFSSQVVQTATVVLFLFGPISAVVGSVPAMASADMAARSLGEVEAALGSGARDTHHGAVLPFDTLDMRNIVYTHHDGAGRNAFKLGPIDFTLRRGETVFITGGNGSGKTTFLKILTGLYRPDGGAISLDGLELAPTDGQAYRELFSVVFNDPHLFRRLYGLSPEARERVPALLQRLEMVGKVQLIDDSFDTLDLSSGQRKRLALLVALLEEKPILILDEWAADQDPVFRMKFYRELLPEFKAAGKTIVAITHDDAYFDVADRRIALNYGSIVKVDDEA
ncbi:cyclic peptide export ABC transporter [Janthinobacterium agaricidamnosum]|uniref:Cyclic peptide transporter family protein n=2 Tax=Janthinobacterium agaricidamnosum TaxID=55508 RepID=W0UZL5_9BURK|nr:cyclic peptide export ABC transporter [Janthinobacterium agaricidamnosum]CCJ67643.1 cyclic peptide transporter; siderophore ABC transporter [Janthinobacterium agaricidamnosum]CDG80820.1 cyclic peptide transporter family protein [Janthinobacterium agaricidamnosum NBRC 102515 = DSM 9628]